MVKVVHDWNPDDWESFALSLLQSRHGSLGVQKVPAAHKGDLGIDFYCTLEGLIYQCYSVTEPVDIQVRADRQKSKITKDLKKMIDGAKEVAKLLLDKPVKKWILLTPLHDSKDVNLHCAKKTSDLRAQNHTHLDPSFEVCINDRNSFPGSALTAAMASLLNISLSVQQPTPAEMTAWQAGSPNLLATAAVKLAKRVPADQVPEAVTDGVELFLKGQALVDALRSSAPDLHEKVISAISSRTRRLGFIGPQGGPAPSTILHTELQMLLAAIMDVAPTLSKMNAEEIAIGTIAEWIMRCPLDFPA